MKQAESFAELYRQIRLRKVPFLVTFAVIVTLTYGFLFMVDFVPVPPEEIEEVNEEAPAAATGETEGTAAVETTSQIDTPESPTTGESTATAGEDPLPRKVIIDALDREVSVLNPNSRDVAVLDEALLSGVVRHPDSADFSEDGNVFILGHSSYLPTVFNQNFRAFNGLQNLEWGDTIRVQSNDTEYVYRVQEVYMAKASEAFVPNTPGEARLTLATCNTFGAKEDRFIVEAVLIDTKRL